MNDNRSIKWISISLKQPQVTRIFLVQRVYILKGECLQTDMNLRPLSKRVGKCECADPVFRCHRSNRSNRKEVVACEFEKPDSCIAIYIYIP